MNKWKYIQLISKRGGLNGEDDGVLALLKWSGKPNTLLVTAEEARAFWENPPAASSDAAPVPPSAK